MRARLHIPAVSLLILAACASTKVTQSWRDPEFSPGKFKKVLVVGLVPDETSRRNLEQDLAALLETEGVTAVTSTRYFQQQQAITADAIKEVAEGEGFDAVLVSRFRGIDYRIQYSGYPYYSYFGYYDPWFTPGYAYAQPEAKMETSLFKVHDSGTLVWAATSDTINPSSSRKKTDELAEKIFERMQKDHVL